MQIWTQNRIDHEAYLVCTTVNSSNKIARSFLDRVSNSKGYYIFKRNNIFPSSCWKPTKIG